MLISIYVYPETDCAGKVIWARASADVSHSPREGLDCKTMATLEEELTSITQRRLNEAIEKGGAK